MIDDLVKRLRFRVEFVDGGNGNVLELPDELCVEAADALENARTNALEEAAKVADDLRCYGAAAISVADAAQKIRALKTNPPLNAGEKNHGH